MPTLDRTGQYRRDLGWKRTASGSRSQQRFYLGRGEGAADLAEMRLGQFWTALERYFEKERDGEDCLWEEWSLALAKQIADGRMVVIADVPCHIQAQAEYEGLVVVAGWLNLLKKYFGLICGMKFSARVIGPDTSCGKKMM